MSNGTWVPGVEKTRPGLYNRFRSMAESRIGSGPTGIVGIPFTADWGPAGVITDISDEAELLELFGSGGTTVCVKRALYGGKTFKPNKVVGFRMVSATAKPATASIDGSVVFTMKYPGTRGNGCAITVAPNILDQTQKDFKIYEGAALVETYTVAPDDIAGLCSAINDNAASLVIAEKSGDTALEDIASKPFAGGDSGENVTAAEYLKALDAFEPIYINTIAPDGVADPDIITLFTGWTKRVRAAGKTVELVVGGSVDDDKDSSKGNQRSRNINDEAVINVIVGGVTASGVKLPSSIVACQVAGLIAATPLNKSTTYKELEDIVEVTVALTDTEISTALKSGSLVLARDFDPETRAVSVRIEKGINTLTTYGEGKSKIWSKIKAIRTMDTIDYDLGRYAAKSVIGEIDNDDDGRAVVISAMKLYLETLAANKAISTDFASSVDTSFTSEGDIVYLSTKALPIDKIEQIFNTIQVA